MSVQLATGFSRLVDDPQIERLWSTDPPAQWVEEVFGVTSSGDGFEWDDPDDDEDEDDYDWDEDEEDEDDFDDDEE